MFAAKMIASVGIVVCLVCVATAQKTEPAPVVTTPQQTEKPAKGKRPLAAFMRTKLDASSKILEGLCLEDRELVKTGAVELRELTKVAVWNVLTDDEYREHSQEFRDNAALVAEAAEEGDFNKAALRWFDVNMSCLDCHDHVRKERKAGK